MQEMLCSINQTTQPIRPQKVFNNWNVVVKGWYVVAKSKHLKKEKTLSVKICGQQLTLFRTKSGKASAVDAFCPHMGMDLARGKVVGEHLKCLFHEWKFSTDGECVDIPCLKKKVEHGKSVQAYPIEEKYGFIWVYSDKKAPDHVYEIEELKGKPILYTSLAPFRRIAHPHITMMNSIDEQHMRSVHKLPMDLDVAIKEEGTRFKVNFTGKPLVDTFLGRVQAFFIGNIWRSSVLFVDGCIGHLTIMIDLKLFNRWNLPQGHFIFSQTFTEKGKTVVWPIIVTERKKGLHGFLLSWTLIHVHKILMWFLAFQDGRVVYKNLRFNQSGLLPEIDNASARWISFVNHKMGLSIWSKEYQEQSTSRNESASVEV
jgi:phenylpropionate dioxygenase-like ring-hydroxylating dioxygenase large terminal subunit